MSWWLILVVVGLLATGLVLLAPIRVRWAVEAGCWQVCVAYLGLQMVWRQGGRQAELLFCGLRLRSSGGQSGEQPATVTGPRADAAGDYESSRHPLRLPHLWTFRSTLRRALIVSVRLLGRLWRCWHLERGSVRVIVQSGNPAFTGWAGGMLWAMRPAIRRFWPALDVDGRFDFAPGGRPRLAVESDLVYRALPLWILWAVGRAAATLPWRGLIRMKRAWAQVG